MRSPLRPLQKWCDDQPKNKLCNLVFNTCQNHLEKKSADLERCQRLNDELNEYVHESKDVLSLKIELEQTKLDAIKEFVEDFLRDLYGPEEYVKLDRIEQQRTRDELLKLFKNELVFNETKFVEDFLEDLYGSEEYVKHRNELQNIRTSKDLVEFLKRVLVFNETNFVKELIEDIDRTGFEIHDDWKKTINTRKELLDYIVQEWDNLLKKETEIIKEVLKFFFTPRGEEFKDETFKNILTKKDLIAYLEKNLETLD